MTLLNICSNSGPLTVFLILKVVAKILCTVLPLIIMVRFFSAMFKGVISGKDVAKEAFEVVKATVAALIIFLLPTFFRFVFVDLLNASDVEIVNCFNSATLENVNKLRENEKIMLQESLDENNRQKAEELNRQKEIEKQKNEEKKKINEEIKRKKEEEERRKQEQQQNSGGTNLKTASKNIIIGDSRTVGMCITLTGDSSGCSFSNGGAKYNGNDIYIAQGSMSYSWFNSTAVPAVNSILANNPDTTFNIYSLMGVNMLLYDIDKYIPTYNNLASNSWKNHNLILVSVNPVDEAVEAQHGYKTKNSDIVSFNNKLSSGVSGANVKYCDTYNSLLNSLSTTDGLHYSASTYQSIYSKINACGS